MKIAPPNSALGHVVAGISSSLWSLLGLLVVSELIYAKLLRFNAVNSARSVANFFALISILFLLYGLAFWVLRRCRASSRRIFTVIVAGALLFRITLLLVGIPPDANLTQTVSRVRADLRSDAVTFDSYFLFDNDIWRYLWDGHVGAEGISPYLYEPQNRNLDAISAPNEGSTHWADIRANVNHPDTPTIYPPVAQLMFRVAHKLAPGSVLVMKLLLVTCDLATIVMVALTLRRLNQPAWNVILYAWNPLVIKAVAASGHVDAILGMLLAAMVYFVVRRCRLMAGMVWGLSILTKISPIVFLPFLVRRLGWPRTLIGMAIVLIGYLPYWDKQGTPLAGLRVFAGEWQFNSGCLSFIQWIVNPLSSHPMLLAKAVATLALVGTIVWLIRADDAKDSTIAFYCVSTLGALIVVSPTVMPWYLVGIIPLAVIARTKSWIQFSYLVCLAFFVMVDGTERGWILWLEYGILAVLLWREYVQERRNWNVQRLSVLPGLRRSPVGGGL